jgi:succinoglycan biosynthesis protein ExoA
LALGGIRTFPTGVAEDADFYFRLGKAGARVVLDPLIVSSYRPRTGWRSLFRQFRRYGQGKAEMFWANGEFPTWRPLAPLALVILLAAAAIVSIVVGSAAPVLWVGGGWLLGLLLVSLQHGLLAPLVAAVAAVMQVSYGLGLAWGLLRGPGPVNALRLPVGRVVPAGGAAADEGDRHPEGR